MDRKVFETELLDGKALPYDENFVKKAIRDSVSVSVNDGYPNGTRNLIIAMEEMSELTKELSKFIRGKGDVTGILEELADVNLVMRYVQEICHISDETLQEALMIKAERLERKVKEGTFQ